MCNRYRTLINGAGLAVAVTLIGAGSASAQQPPPIHGVTGTVATEETVKETQKAGRTILSKAGRLFGLNRKDADSGDPAGDEAFGRFKEGMSVTARYGTAGENQTFEELESLSDGSAGNIDAVVTAVNRNDRTISIRRADGPLQTLRLSDRAAAGAGEDIGKGRVILYVKGDAGQRVAHYFIRVR
jgi:hypothetical protein